MTYMEITTCRRLLTPAFNAWSDYARPPAVQP